MRSVFERNEGLSENLDIGAVAKYIKIPTNKHIRHVIQNETSKSEPPEIPTAFKMIHRDVSHLQKSLYEMTP